LVQVNAFALVGIWQVQAQAQAQADSGCLQELGGFKERIEGFAILETQQDDIAIGDGAIDHQALQHLDDQ
jgi:hypothetical protein